LIDKGQRLIDTTQTGLFTNQKQRHVNAGGCCTTNHSDTQWLRDFPHLHTHRLGDIDNHLVQGLWRPILKRLQGLFYLYQRIGCNRA